MTITQDAINAHRSQCEAAYLTGRHIDELVRVINHLTAAAQFAITSIDGGISADARQVLAHALERYANAAA